MQPPQDSHDEREAVSPSPLGQIEGERLDAEEPLKCVWSGFPNYDRSCRSRIPASVVVKAWHREMHLKGTEEGFFYFSWRSGVWLAYGLRDGGVRGVYCPTHCSERNLREPQEDAASGGQPMGIALQ
jgi:hypothetical protein